MKQIFFLTLFVQACLHCESIFVENIPLIRERNPKAHENNSENPSLYVNSVGGIYTRPHEELCRPHIKQIRTDITNLIGREVLVGESIEMCTICLEGIKTGTLLMDLDNCEHKFHLKCIQQWANVKNNCPSCTKQAFN